MATARGGTNWSWEETLVAFRLYCRIPFGQLHKTNPQIVALSQVLGRTPSSVGMKACNFASLDPAQRARGITGLPNRSRLEELVWERFTDDSESLAAEAEAAYARLTADATPATQTDSDAIAANPPEPPDGPTEVERSVRVRRVQGFFRSAVLVSYEGRCALTGLAVPELLTASHIIPWSASPERRADPRNGLCLNALHDRAFDRGLITFDADLRLVVSPLVRSDPTLGDFKPLFSEAGRTLRSAIRFAPDSVAMEYHRRMIFRCG